MLLPKDEDPTLWSLAILYQDRDWYGDVGYDQFGRPVVYVKYECHETICNIVDRCGGKQVLVHLLASHTAKANDFMNKPQEAGYLLTFKPSTECAVSKMSVSCESCLPDFNESLSDEEEEDRRLELSVQILTDELDRLERICGTNILGEIFFECHDKNNAVTNLSIKFPEVRRAMDKLYDQYGFDLLYDELEL